MLFTVTVSEHTTARIHRLCCLYLLVLFVYDVNQVNIHSYLGPPDITGHVSVLQNSHNTP